MEIKREPLDPRAPSEFRSRQLVAKQMLDLTNPKLDFVAAGKSMAVPSVRVTTAAELAAELLRSYATEGPSLIEAVIQG